MNKVVLAYSGGLDTLICIHWLQQVKGWRVIAFLAQLGQPAYLDPTGEKALQLGASAVLVRDLREKFIKDYIWRTIKAEAHYEKDYLLAAALTRPLITEEMVKITEEENCSYFAHGSRGVSNDHTRFETCLKALAPGLKIVAPLQELGLYSIQDDLAYAQKFNLPISNVKYTLYNIEYNLWGVNVQLVPKQVGNFWEELPPDTYVMTTPPQETPDEPVSLELGFQQGLPVTLDNKTYTPLNLIEILNRIGGRNGIGRIEMIESKISGEKSRETYESPAASIIYAAHHALAEIALDKETLRFQETASETYGKLVYNGAWFSLLRESLDKFFDHIQPRLNGVVRLKLFKGNLTVVGRKLY